MLPNNNCNSWFENGLSGTCGAAKMMIVRVGWGLKWLWKGFEMVVVVGDGDGRKRREAIGKKPPVDGAAEGEGEEEVVEQGMRFAVAASEKGWDLQRWPENRSGVKGGDDGAGNFRFF
ncbi:hypothetical protein L1987_71440 [Smallanthus sonchifolius]|uniref:Uncharacterized protein n=1 Tax=Smallanthus sonchifolius TaxID=185202 RepID=A0ACB9ASR0_9ASTR|nr:hypothetical protein L1987_71440 [Smallanthus sonchifolius]